MEQRWRGERVARLELVFEERRADEVLYEWNVVSRTTTEGGGRLVDEHSTRARSSPTALAACERRSQQLPAKGEGCISHRSA